MIFVTGDIHGWTDIRKLNTDKFPIQKELTKEDTLIICGDFGLVWAQEESDQERYWLKWLEDKNFTTVFVDGNHENFDRLYGYPIAEWHGGMVHIIRPNIYHLMRGEVFEIEGKKFFCFGGASSHDISDGILDITDEATIYRYRVMNLQFRIKNYSWWEQELPTWEEMKNGLDNLKKVDYKVDYVITHCLPTEVQAMYSIGEYKKDKLTNYFESLLQDRENKLEFKKWFSGHYHEDMNITEKFRIIYNDIVEIE